LHVCAGMLAGSMGKDVLYDTMNRERPECVSSMNMSRTRRFRPLSHPAKKPMLSDDTWHSGLAKDARVSRALRSYQRTAYDGQTTQSVGLSCDEGFVPLDSNGL